MIIIDSIVAAFYFSASLVWTELAVNCVQPTQQQPGFRGKESARHLNRTERIADSWWRRRPGRLVSTAALVLLQTVLQRAAHNAAPTDQR